MKRSGSAAVLGLLLAAFNHAPAQAREMADGDYERFRNAAGVIQYCQNMGHLTPEMADQVFAVFDSILEPVEATLTPEQIAVGDAAERRGTEGKFGEEEAALDIVEEAKRAHTTPAALCQDTHAKFIERVKSQGSEAYAQVRNQIGVMQYCRDQGHITPARAEEVIVFFRRLIDNYPLAQTPEAAVSGEEAEKDGMAGKWGPPPRIDIAGMAPLMTAASLCETLSSGIAGK